MLKASTHPTAPATEGAAAGGYRLEVDGLRAVAVLAVLLFHTGVPGFTGGFVGVDVFFVISGYLITRLILGELEGDGFRFARFYGRRARRLFPAMFVTLAATLAASIVVLAPDHLVELSLSLVYSLLSLSNILFWSQAGYFDIASSFKPLLHTWSLGVEEQFYLAWPISVWLAYRLRRRSGVLALIALVGILSLVAAEHTVGRSPEAAFFLTPFRMCELALGAACLWLEPRAEARSWWRELLTLAGLAVIAYAVFRFAPGRRFPGLKAMVPCAGAAMILVAGRGRVAGALLANRLAVGTGLISYSLYLVHWPLIALWRYGRTTAWSQTERAAIIASAILIATAMYFLVERPFRRQRSGARPLSDPAFGLACAGLALALILPAVATIAARGWPNRVAARLRGAIAGIEEMKLHHFHSADAQNKLPFPAPGRRNAVIVGDSHGADLLTALLSAGSTLNFRMMHIRWFCQPILGDRPFGDGTPIQSREIAENCRQEGQALQDNPLLRDADLILIASSWQDYGLAGLPATIEYFKAHYHARIVLFGARYLLADPGALLIRVSTYEEANRLFDGAKGIEANEKERAALSAVAERSGVDLVDLRPYACDKTASGWFCPLLLDEGELLYWDWHHWTDAGARRVGRRLRDDGRYAFLF